MNTENRMHLSNLFKTFLHFTSTIFQKIVIIRTFRRSLFAIEMFCFPLAEKVSDFHKYDSDKTLFIISACVQNPVYESAVAGDRREER